MRAGYPALTAWRKRIGDTPPTRWTFDNLWRAAMAESEAKDSKDNAEREQHYQREAVALLLGEPVQRVRLTHDTMQRYLSAVATAAREVAA